MSFYLVMLIISIVCGTMFVSAVNTIDQEPDEDRHVHLESYIDTKEKVFAIIGVVLVTMAVTTITGFSQALGMIIFGLLSLTMALLAQKMQDRALVLALAYLTANFVIGMVISYAVHLDKLDNYSDLSWTLELIFIAVIVAIDLSLFVRINIALYLKDKKFLSQDDEDDYDYEDEDDVDDYEDDEDYEDEYEDDYEDYDRDYTRYYPYRPARR